MAEAVRGASAILALVLVLEEPGALAGRGLRVGRYGVRR